MEDIFLGDNKYLGNSDKISIADISAFCELSQLYMVNAEINSENHPRLFQWYENMKTIPEVSEVFQMF